MMLGVNLILAATAIASLALAGDFAAASAAGTWVGQISDSACGAKHEAAAEGEEKLSDDDCTRTCIRGGSTFVLISSDAAVFKIANQDFADLAVNAGRSVRVTGDLNAGAITVTRIETK
jgi:hypothetical protein